MALVRNIGGVGATDAEKVFSAMRSRGHDSRPNLPTRLSEVDRTPAGPGITPNVLRIGSSIAFDENAVVGTDSDIQNGFIAASIVAAALMFGKGRSVGRKKRSLLIPAAILGAGALWYFTSNNDPELSGLSSTPGVLKIPDTLRDAAFARTPQVGPDYYDLIYRDVLIGMLPRYKDLINKMSLREQQVLYHLVVDVPATGVIQANEPQVFAELVALKQKYNIPFYA